MGLFLVWCHRLICIVLSLCKHACKEVCDVNPGIDPYPLLAWSCARWWPDFVTFTAYKKSRFVLKGGKKAQCISNRCKDLFERKKYFGARCTLTILVPLWFIIISSAVFSIFKVLFSGFLQFNGTFVEGKNNSKYRDCALQRSFPKTLIPPPPRPQLIYAIVFSPFSHEWRES